MCIYVMCVFCVQLDSSHVPAWKRHIIFLSMDAQNLEIHRKRGMCLINNADIIANVAALILCSLSEAGGSRDAWNRLIS